jgi:hypothetical protein
MKVEMQRLPEAFPWLDTPLLETLTLSGFSTLHAIQKKGPQKLLDVKGMDQAKADELHAYAVERVRELEEEKARRIEEERLLARQAAAAEAAAAAAETEEAASAESQTQTDEQGGTSGEEATPGTSDTDEEPTEAGRSG